MDTERLKEAWLVYRRNFRKAVRDAGVEFDTEKLHEPPPGVDLMEGVNATHDELLAYAHWKRSDDVHLTSMLHRAAATGLAIELGMHELHTEFDTISWRIRDVRNTLPEDSKDRERLNDSLAAVDRFRTTLGFMAGLAHKRLGSYQTSGAEILRHLDQIYGFVLKRYDIELTVSDSFREAKADGRESLIVPVFINLVRNALLWTSKVDRPRKIHLDATEVEVEPYDDGTPRTKWILEVSDSGPGVPEHMREVIFQPFRSGRGSTGLGLYLCRRNLGRDRSTVIVSPEPSALGGARFLVGPAEVLAPTATLPLSVRERLRADAIGIAQLVIDGQSRELLELHQDEYADLMREALRVRLEGPRHPDDHFIVRLAEAIEDVVRGRNPPESLQSVLDDELGVDPTAAPRS